jgi:membrane-associated phospholipid phosphatase
VSVSSFNSKEKSMHKHDMKNYGIAVMLLVSFIGFTFLVKTTDVQPVGPAHSSVGFASFNSCIRSITGYHRIWYTITDWLGIAAILTACSFAALGLYQWIVRKSLRKVDPDILLLGLFYLSVIGAYIFFENNIVNYRPVLMNGYLEPSYPSSHTMIVVCVMGSAMVQCKYRFKNKVLVWITETVAAIIILVTVAGRLISGVHWFTDIAGGLLLSLSLLSLYIAAVKKTCHIHDSHKTVVL